MPESAVSERLSAGVVPANRLVGSVRLSQDAIAGARGACSRKERVRKLRIDDDICSLSLALTTLVASFYDLGTRKLLLFGNDPLRAPPVSDDELARFVDDLAKQPRDALARLAGNFGLVFVDVNAHRTILACDRAARRPLSFHVDRDQVTFGLDARDVDRLANRASQLRAQAVFDYLRGHVIPAPQTIHAGISRLLPAQYVDVAAGRISSAFYWEPDYAPRQTSFAHARDSLLSLLTESVTREIGAGKTGAFLSGGTDSSTVAGLLGKVTHSPANTYSIGFGESGYDEMDYARIAARHFATKHHEYYVTPDDLVEAIPMVACAYDQPFGNSSALPAYACARLAASDGIARLLGGDGGDEIFGGNARYAKQTLFDAYRAMPPAIDRTLIEAALVRPSLVRAMPVVSKMRSYVVQARVPMPDRLHTYNLVDRIGLREMFDGDFLAGIDPDEPARAERDWYGRCRSPDVVNCMLQYDWKYTLADNDLPKVTMTCDLAGVEIAFPMLDESLVEFANALPASWKVRRLRLRPFFKSALASFLPPEIIRKRKHGFGLPFGAWLVRHDGLRKLADDALSTFATRGIVKRSLIDDLFRNRLGEHAGYYGELVWTMMMLELWLRSSGESRVCLERR
ncbi:MAG TPA: asparagine synthase C-terminal domain-containing protein [Casimicrobiaceae bacterium]|nr:asparagine synthase C-terminal domain-containing protein [Casimicrobiaceae bacterium]